MKKINRNARLSVRNYQTKKKHNERGMQKHKQTRTAKMTRQKGWGDVMRK